MVMMCATLAVLWMVWWSFLRIITGRALPHEWLSISLDANVVGFAATVHQHSPLMAHLIVMHTVVFLIVFVAAYFIGGMERPTFGRV